MTSVAIVGSVDSQPEELLKGPDIRVSKLDVSGLEALLKPGAALPEVVMLDARGGAGLPPTVAALKRQQPQVGVIVLAHAMDPALLPDAMRAGVNEVVAEPLTQEAMDAAIVRVVGQRTAIETGQVFAFVGAKGGVGTTTVAVNVAAPLAAIVKQARALLIDLHQGGGDAAVFLGAEPRFTVKDALENTHRLDRVLLRSMVVPVAAELDFLGSPEAVTHSQADAGRLRTLIGAAASTYRFTVLDLSSSDGAVMDSLDHVSRIVLVANQELATVRSARRMTAALQERYGKDKLSVVLSRSDRQADIGHADVERAVGMAVAYTFPSDYRQALQALNKGRPLAFDNHNELAAAFKRFAQQLTGIRAEKTARPGLLGRLTQGRN